MADEPGAPATAPGAPAAEPVKYIGPSIFDVLDGSGIAITGYVDTSYEHLSGNGEFSSFTPDRVFDARHDSFTVNQAAITIAMQPKEGLGRAAEVRPPSLASSLTELPTTQSGIG